MQIHRLRHRSSRFSRPLSAHTTITACTHSNDYLCLRSRICGVVRFVGLNHTIHWNGLDECMCELVWTNLGYQVANHNPVKQRKSYKRRNMIAQNDSWSQSCSRWGRLWVSLPPSTDLTPFPPPDFNHCLWSRRRRPLTYCSRPPVLAERECLPLP